MAEEIKNTVVRKIELAGRAVKKAMSEALRDGVRTKVMFTLQMSVPVMDIEFTEMYLEDDQPAPNAHTDAENDAYNAMVEGIVYATDLGPTEARTVARMQLKQLKKQGLITNVTEGCDAESTGQADPH